MNNVCEFTFPSANVDYYFFFSDCELLLVQETIQLMFV